jgi:hypothetical protein
MGAWAKAPSCVEHVEQAALGANSLQILMVIIWIGFIKINDG